MRMSNALGKLSPSGIVCHVECMTGADESISSSEQRQQDVCTEQRLGWFDGQEMQGWTENVPNTERLFSKSHNNAIYGHDETGYGNTACHGVAAKSLKR